MKFCYCPECRELHPRNWHARDDCTRCRGPCAIITIPTSFAGYLMYALSAVALVLIVVHLLGIDWPLSDYDIPLIFAAILAGFVCSYIEIGRGTRLAYEKVEKKV